VFDAAYSISGHVALAALEMQIDRLNRRGLVTFLGAVIAWPQMARAEQSKNLPLIGFLPLGSPSNRYDASYVEAFRKGATFHWKSCGLPRKVIMTMLS
jgi:hypothetical protein